MDGSSSKSVSGFDISALPTASICCSPPESVPAACDTRSESRGNNANTYSSVSLISFLFFRVYAPSNRLSFTESSANTRLPSGTCVNPSRTILCAGIFKRLCPL